MSPGTSSLVAFIVAVGAVLVACVAVGVVVLSARIRRGSHVASDRLARATETVGQESARIRTVLGRIEADAERFRRQDAAMERLLVDMSAALLPLRRMIEGATRGRLASLIRMASAASRAAQVALLWR